MEPDDDDIRGMYVYSTSTANVRILNNIFVNDGTIGCCINDCSSAGDVTDCNYNNFFSNSSVIGCLGSTTYATLADWQGNGRGFDANSLSVDPGYISVSDLHVSNTLLNDTGIAITGINDDIDGEARDNPPYIGADEISPTPVTLLSVYGKNAGNTNIIHWSTASETNNEIFTIQKSKDIKEWQNIGQVTGARNSNSLLNYTFADHEPYPVNTYYRIKQTDYDGIRTFSKVISISGENTANTLLEIFPNPVQDYAFINIPGNDEEYNLCITSASGKIFLQTGNIKEYHRIDMTGMPNGIYFLRLSNNKKVMVKKIMVMG